VSANYEAIFHHLSVSNLSLIPQATTPECYTDDNRTAVPDPLPKVDKFIFVVFASIGLLLIVGTAFDLWDRFLSAEHVKRENIFSKSLLAFSAYTNGLHLLSTSTGGSDHLGCMNGMRFLSMTWVVLGHSFFVLMMTYSALRNTLLLPEIIGGSVGLAFEAVLNALPSVDSFFLMSGTLTSYLMFKELERAGSDLSRHTVTFIMYYVHRYLRLTITYALIMGVIIAIVPHVYYGPGWSAVNIEAEACRTNWWAHFLYVNTLLKSMTGNNMDMCMGVSWYLVDDMIFHWFSPIILYPMYLLWKQTKRHMAGSIFWLAVMGAFTSGIAYISYTTGQPPQDMIQGVNYPRNYTYHVDFYFVPWARYQPYLVGILLGYILHHTRGKKIIINEQLNILMWQAAFLTGFAVVYGLHDARVSLTGTLLAATIYNTFQRLAWPLALSWVIFACVKGYGGPINDFLSWPVFGPLSRLTYCSFLFHISILEIFAGSVLSTFAKDFREAVQQKGTF
jgi:peptidoglycan/LPS O-acetylase OafA/YrhL